MLKAVKPCEALDEDLLHLGSSIFSLLHSLLENRTFYTLNVEELED